MPHLVENIITKLPLREWISNTRGNKNYANRSANGSTQHKVPRDYIMTSIKIAISLLEPLVSAEESGQLIDLSSGDGDMADKVTVEFQTKDELRAHFDSVDQGENNIKIPVNDTSFRQIHDLGLVFYELFSGGEKPPQSIIDAASASSSSNSPSIHISELNLKDDLYDIREEDYANDDSENDSCKRRRGKLGTLSDLTLESLRSKDVPNQLCDLIFNMIDCISEELRGSDCYEKFDDIRTDLQMMLENPNTYLCRVDLDHVSSDTAKPEQDVFARDKEFSVLQSAYMRSVSGSAELVLVAGDAGTGKSTLVNQLEQFIIADNGVYLSGKFDQRNQKPFSALAAAFDDYFGAFLLSEGSEKAQDVASKLQMVLILNQDDLIYLIKPIPNLALVLSIEEEGGDTSYQDCENAQKRLHHLFCCLIESITSFLDTPLTIFLDDVQWADEASMSVLSQILRTSRINKRVFFVAAYRDNEIEADHPIFEAIESSHDFGMTTTKIQLDCLDKAAVNMLVSKVLCLSPRLVTGLSDIIFSKTKGNLLFLTQLLQGLTREGLLRVDLSRRRWVWNEEKIHSRSLPDNVASYFLSNISRLDESVQNSLLVLSCFGAPPTYDILTAIESSLGLSLIGPIESAINEGIVIKETNESYRFSHDRLKQSVYEMILESDRCMCHKQYGMALMASPLSNVNVIVLFTAVKQINLAGICAGWSSEELIEVARYNLLAGKKAMSFSDFSVAFNYFDFGMTFLPKQHWENHYTLSLELFELAAKCCQIIGDTNSLTILTDQIMTHASCMEDKLNIIFIHMISLTYALEVSLSMEKGLMALRQLGHEVPSTITDENSRFNIAKTLEKFEGIADDDILNYRLMTDRKSIMAMKFLAKLENTVQQVRPDLQPFITVEMMKLTLSHGMSPMSPIG